MTMSRQEVCSKGGKAAHAKGTAYKWTGGKDGTAAAAGRKGGEASRGGRGRQSLEDQRDNVPLHIAIDENEV